MDGARPSSGARRDEPRPRRRSLRRPDGRRDRARTTRGPCPRWTARSEDSCERIRDRVAELAGDARPRVVSEMEAALSQVEYDLNGAEFLLAELRRRSAASGAAAATRRRSPPTAPRCGARGARSTPCARLRGWGARARRG